MYRAGGWKKNKLDWERMAAQSTLYREFTIAPGGVKFAVITSGDEAKRIGYTVRCKRISKS